jgi:glycosyltransferase involved in cell wall biosynthesis
VTISIVITTYGEDEWRELAWSRAYPSVVDQGADDIVVHHAPDLTIGPARNLSSSLATGDHLIHLDADDELEPGYVQEMRQAAEGRTQPTLYQPAVRYMRKQQMANPILIPTKDLRTDNFLVIGTMCPASLFREVGGFSDYPHGFEDWSCWAKLWKAGCEIVQVPHATYRAHINPQSAHRTLWRDRQSQVAMHLKVQAELFPEMA